MGDSVQLGGAATSDVHTGCASSGEALCNVGTDTGAGSSDEHDAIGDGEEVEVEVDAEELSDNQLDLIYRK